MTLLLLIVINVGLILPEKLQLTQYHVTELIPMPPLRPEPAPLKVKPAVQAKLLPAVKLPVFEQPKLVLPREVRRDSSAAGRSAKSGGQPVRGSAVENGGKRGASATGAHGRFRRQFAEANSERCG